ncbi:MAG: transglutaminase-like cysteine peptidase [Ancalomicrobiaceae bacterium]|nr:transglutaminase-like cysteine peptidase [Ancalomicrobiaceae bacterium]
MKTTTAVFLATFTAAYAIQYTTVSAGPAEIVRFMDTRGPTSAPVGFIQFCRSNMQDCVGTSSVPPKVVLTPAKWEELVTINTDVNNRIEPVTDLENYGVPEWWSYPDNGRGDCEDYQLLKRKLLVNRGWPVGALLMTVVRDQNNDGHAVLTVRTDRGDLVLDNQNPQILIWSQTAYQFIKRQSPIDVSHWEGIEDHRTDFVASAAR